MFTLLTAGERKLICLLAVGIWALISIRTSWIADDAMITLRSVLNFVHGLGPVFNVGERVQSFTHSTWFFILSIVTILIDDPYVAIVASSIGTSLLLVWLIAAKFPHPLLVLTALALSRAFVDFLNSGLENPLTFLLLALVALRASQQDNHERSEGWIYLLLGMMVLTRPDLAIFLASYLVYHFRWSHIRSLCLGLMPTAIWVIFSVFYYGIPIPNSALAKITTSIPKVELVTQGMKYVLHSLYTDSLTVIVTMLFPVVAIWCGRQLWLALAVVLYVIYIVSVGGDFMAGRFLSVPFFASTIGFALLGGRVVLVPLHNTAIALCISVLGFQAVGPTFLSGKAYTGGIGLDGIADERGYWFPVYGTLNALSKHSWPRLPEWSVGKIARISEIRTICGGLGNAALHAGPTVHYVDTCALADPLLSRLPMKYLGPGEWRIGHFYRQLPSDYLNVLRGTVKVISEPNAADLYSDVSLVTRGSLLSVDRILAIWRLAFKDYRVTELYSKGSVVESEIESSFWSKVDQKLEESRRLVLEATKTSDAIDKRQSLASASASLVEALDYMKAAAAYSSRDAAVEAKAAKVLSDVKIIMRAIDYERKSLKN